MSDKIKYLQQLKEQLKEERQPWEASWRDLSDYISPYRAKFLPTDGNNNKKSSNKIINNTATLSARVLQSGLMSGNTSPARPWMRVTTTVEQQVDSYAAHLWLDDVTTILLNIFAESNVYLALPTIYHDLGVYGIGSMAVLEDDEDVIRCYTYSIGSYWVGTNTRGVVDMWMRESQMTARNMEKEYGKDKLPSFIQDSLNNNRGENKYTVTQAIYPNADYDPRFSLGPNSKKYCSDHYVEMGNNSRSEGQSSMLRESGFDEFPLMCPRWEVVDEDVYGRGPGVIALPDIKALQFYERKIATAVELELNPPMLIPGHLKTTAFSLLPGANNIMDANSENKGVRPAIEIKFNIKDAEGLMNRHENKIQDSFYTSLFMMLTNSDRVQPLTAREVDERSSEKLQMISPVLERMSDELLSPLIDRVFAIAWRKRLIPLPPPELTGVKLKIEYTSLMAMVQKQITLAAVDRYIGHMITVGGIEPSALDNVNWDEDSKEYAKRLGVPTKLLNSSSTVDARRKARAEAAQQAQAADNAVKQSQAAKNLSQSNTQSPNGLTAILGQNGGL